MTQVLNYPKFKAFYPAPNGTVPLDGGKVYTYNSGTTIPLLTYSDANRTIPNTNPVILDANGEAWIIPSTTGIYTVAIYDKNDVLVWSYDGIGADASAAPVNVLRLDLADSTNVANGDAMIAFKQPFTGAQPSTVHTKLSSIICAFDFMTPAEIADVQAGTALVDVTTAVQNALNAAKLVRFPAGTYKITSSLLLNDGQKIMGEGRTSVTFKAALGAPIFKKASSPATLNGVTIEGITVDNTTSATANGVGFDFTSMTATTINDVAANNVTIGYKLYNTSQLEGNLVYSNACVTCIDTDASNPSADVRLEWASLLLSTNGIIIRNGSDRFVVRNGSMTCTNNITVAGATPFTMLHFESINISSGISFASGASTGRIAWINVVAANAPTFLAMTGTLGPYDFFGAGTPEGALAAPVGATFRRTNGGAGTSFYVKESGTGNTGWVGK